MFGTSLLGRPMHRIGGGGFLEGFLFHSTLPPGPANKPSPAQPPRPGESNSPGFRLPAPVPIEPDGGFYLRFGKRLLDLVIGGLVFLISLPLLLALAIAIKVDTPGPVFYRSTRVGRGGGTFTFYKLRSMIRDAEKDRERIAHLNEVSGPVFKIARDPRTTKVGRFLRRTSLDELPQILNVLRGDMSLVGPRPPIPDEVEHYEPWQLRRLSVLPGITCLWQVSGRSSLDFDEWMRLDMEYVDRRSLALDLRIMARTIPAVLIGEGAY